MSRSTLTRYAPIYASPFTRDRQDGGGGGEEGGQREVADDDVDDTGTEDTDADDGDDDADDDDEPLKDAGKKALQAEREKVKARNREIRELRAQLAAKPKGEGVEGDDDPEARKAAQIEAARELAKPLIVESKAERLLTEAGLIGPPAPVLRLLSLDDVEIEYDSRGRVADIDGLDDQIDQLREDYPALFAPKKRTAGRIDGSDKDRRTDAGREKKSASALQAQGILGGRRGR